MLILVLFDSDSNMLMVIRGFERKRRKRLPLETEEGGWTELGGQGEGKDGGGAVSLEILVCVSYFFDLWLMMMLIIEIFSSSPVTLPRLCNASFPLLLVALNLPSLYALSPLLLAWTLAYAALNISNAIVEKLF